MSAQAFRIRPARPGDEPAAYRVCLLTGDSGADASALHATGPDLLGHIYVGAYLALEPDLALLLEDGEGVCGYVLGALKSREFFRRYATEWLPPLQLRTARPAGAPATLSPTDQLRLLIHEPDLFCPEPYDEFPAHLHIDLLPRAQGQGWGRRMMEALLAKLSAKGAPGVHLGMHASNTRAAEFYRRMGFHELVRVDDSLYFGKRLSVNS